jgi:hypothetical protein
MRIVSVTSVLGGVAAFALASPTAGAQGTQPFSVQVSALAAHVTLSPSDGFGATFSELGGEAQIRYAPSKHWSLGAGFQFTTGTNQGQTLAMSGVFLEPRVTLGVGTPRITPYLAARLAFMRGTDTFEGESINLNGQTLGGGAGALIPISKRIQLDVSALFAKNRIGSGGFSSMGYVVRSGLSVGFGGR